MTTQLVEVKASQSGYGSVTFVWGGYHTIWQFKSKAAFESCDFIQAKELTTRPGYVFLSSIGTYYFACSVYGHCGAGQKLTLVIKGDAVNTGLVSRTHLHVVLFVQFKSLNL